MPLLPEDHEYLDSRGAAFDIEEEAGFTCVILKGWCLPEGLNHASADVLLRLPPGYPDIAPDMWWIDPPLLRQDGAEIAATQSTESYLGRNWQRWSRHFQSGQWRPGIDRLASFVALLDAELRRAAVGRAA